MRNSWQTEYESVDASPVKSFFVSMLTRDIKLEEAILDLLDNCVDGILRTQVPGRSSRPYDGYWAEIEFNKDSFSIADNCGGIPWDRRDYAFRMGPRPNRGGDTPGTVGVYGIGMKRAIFKMGRHSLISTQNVDQRYEVEITPAWLESEEEWTIPVRAARRSLRQDGTTIVVGDLLPSIQERFSESKAFKSELTSMVSKHYAFIIDKGLQVKINGTVVKPQPTRLVFHGGASKAPAVRPFIFETSTPDGIDVFLAVGFTRPIPSEDEAQKEQDETRYSSLDAGWTVVCNDRAVLYCDRSELTGWGEAGVPRYHTQFTAISGIVEFRGDASKLPTTTTKRGIDASSPLYLQVKNKMREGMRMFTDYTNRWKGRAEESRKHIQSAGPPLAFEEVRSKAQRMPLASTTRTVPAGRQYKPNLPLPKRLDPRQRRISFTKDEADVRAVAEYLLGDPEAEPSLAGEKCFDLVLREARR